MPAPAEPGTFVVLEGGEAVGKSTQVRLLVDRLRATGRDVVATFEPGATPVGGVIRGLFLGRSAGPVSARAEALLVAADRAEHAATVVRPAIDRGAVVVSDRHVPSSLAYQGIGQGLGVDEIAALSRWATDGLTPDVVVVLDVPAAVAEARRPGGSGDRMETESGAFHERVRAAYRELAGPLGWTVVAADADPAIVAERVWAAVAPALR